MSEISFNFLTKNKYLRIDTDFFTKSNLILDNRLENYGYDRLIDISKEITDFGAFSQTNLIEFKEKGVLFLRNQDVRESYIDLNDNVFIDKSVYHQLTLHLEENDIVVPRVGTLGNAGIITKEMLPCSANQNLAVIRVKNGFNPFVLLSVLISNIGNNQIDRLSTGNVQQWLNLETIGNIKIPKFSSEICNKLESLIKKSHNNLNKSKQKYTEAKTLLLENLGLQNFQATCEPVNIKLLKESFLQTGRLDAEYYQLKYEQYWNLIQSQDHTLIRDEYLHITKKPDWTKSIYQYIEIGDVNVTDGSYQTNWIETQELPANAKIQVQTGDILISTVRPYRGAVTIIGENDRDLVVSGAFTVLRQKPNSMFNNEVLKVLLCSDLYKDWLLQFNVGTSYPVIKDEDVLNLPIPKISGEIQEKIAEYIRQSNDLRQQAQDLLAQAKNNVEWKIENYSCIENNQRGVNESNYQILLEKSAYFTYLAEWTLLESLLLAQKVNVSIQSFSESFGTSGRFDAEYYQPKFARLFKQLANFKTMKLGEIVSLQKSIEPGSEAYQTDGIPFVRVSDLSKFGISQTDKFLNPADFTETIRPKKDSILLTKDGTVGIAYRVPQDLNMITSGAIVHLELKTDDILPDYLALVLNSKTVQLQAERDAGGSIIQHWKPSEILDVVIPVLPKHIQQTISDKVQQSFALKAESENLLLQAKMLVETEIENME